MSKSTKIDKETQFMLYLIEEDEVVGYVGEAYSSLLLNPAVTWAKFILTDDAPNNNGQRVPQTEFKNLIKSGLHMPVKMAYGKINDDHDDSLPIGTITHLKQEDNKVIALAALWTEERPSDVSYIKEKVAAGESINVSWEILYGDYDIDDTGIVDLLDTYLKAATIVGRPAYAGRTPILAVAAKSWSKAYIDELEDSAFLYVKEVESRNESDEQLITKKIRQFPVRDNHGKLVKDRLVMASAEIIKSDLDDELKSNLDKTIKKLLKENAKSDEITSEKAEEFKMEESKLDELKELQEKYSQLEKDLTNALDTLKAKETELVEAIQAKADFESELASLREFKASIDAEKEEIQKLALVKTKFTEAGLEKADEYFVDNKEKLLKLASDESALDFMIQELISFKNENEDKEDKSEEKASEKKGPKIPNLPADIEESLTVSELVKALKEKSK